MVAVVEEDGREADKLRQGKGHQRCIRIQPPTIKDHRGLTALLDEVDLQYHNYFLPETKPLKAASWTVSRRPK